jgi:four helix bundle protein
MKDFKKLLIWQKGMEIVNELYTNCKYFPREELFGMRSQVTRAAVSIAANIAEGSAKNTEREYKQYLERALGSAFELETHLLIVKTQKWFLNNIVDGLLAKVIEEQRMVSSFIHRLKLEA